MNKRISNLSQVFPEETAYFYGFPAEGDAGFYNACPPEVEELVAMRPAVCAGPDVRIVTFANTVTSRVLGAMRDDFGVPMMSNNQIIQMPEDIGTSMVGRQRNSRVRDVLAEMIPNGRLVMAQPFTEQELRGKYLIDPTVTSWLNDKGNIRELVPEEYRTPEYGNVLNGREFAQIDGSKFPYPCVVKIGASSAGDGVKICKSLEEFMAVQQAFRSNDTPIVVQKYIDRIDELDIKFVIHPDSAKLFEFLGYSGEVIFDGHQPLGGIVHNTNQLPKKVQKIYQVLADKILPKLREKGWFGVGGVDVLIDQDGKFFFNDFNCRMTATMAQTMQINSGILGDKSLASFIGRFNGSLDEFRIMMQRYAQHGSLDHILNIVALAEDSNAVRLHGGVLFDQMEALRDNVAVLRKHGIHSDSFKKIDG